MQTLSDAHCRHKNNAISVFIIPFNQPNYNGIYLEQVEGVQYFIYN